MGVVQELWQGCTPVVTKSRQNAKQQSVIILHLVSLKIQNKNQVVIYQAKNKFNMAANFLFFFSVLFLRSNIIASISG